MRDIYQLQISINPKTMQKGTGNAIIYGHGEREKEVYAAFDQ